MLHQFNNSFDRTSFDGVIGAVSRMNGNRMHHIGFPDSFNFDACAKARLAQNTSRALRMPWLFSSTAEQGRAAARKEAARLGADSARILTRCDELEFHTMLQETHEFLCRRPSDF